ncbi:MULTISPECIES: flagellar hook-associated family protein [Xanthobacter]|uniref:flagellar hook-associated family protein n=1 Tax=Xanthobacter TaxID=279 RepID=UPI001F44D2D2|nr:MULTISPECIES: flagellar hook-associated family protein [unclassified Xanthobacter]
MKSSFVSTLTWTSSALKSVARLQNEMAKATTEIATGRYADVGLSLGLRTGQSVSLYSTKAAISSQTLSNNFASNIVGTSQTVMAKLIADGDEFLQDLITAQSSSADPKTLVTQAETALATLTDNLNTSDGQRYLFAGTNSSVQPMAAYEDGPEAAVTAAFTAAFGVSPTDPAVSNISASDMETFLNGTFADLFADPSWGNTWSSASDQPLTSQISSNARANITTTANIDGVRNLTMALTMVAKLGTANLSAETRAVLVDKATTVAGAAISQITTVSASLGVTQSRINKANDVLSSASTLVETQISNLEGVDTAEAKTRLDNMTTQLEMSYSTTATLMQLSLLNYA